MDVNHSPHPGRQSLVIYPLMTSTFVHVSPLPILVPDHALPCFYVLSLLPVLGITLGLVDVLVWFGLVLLEWFYCCEWPCALYLGLCPHLQPSPGGVSRGAWPWHLSCHSLSAQGTWMLLCPSGPSYHVPMPWTPIKAAALMGLCFPNLFHSLLFLSRCLSSHKLSPLLSGCVHTQVAFVSVNRCKGCGHAAVMWPLQHQAWISVFSTCLPSAGELLSFTASLTMPDQTSLSHFSPSNACSHLSSISTLDSLKVHFCPQHRRSQD